MEFKNLAYLAEITRELNELKTALAANHKHGRVTSVRVDFGTDGFGSKTQYATIEIGSNVNAISKVIGEAVNARIAELETILGKADGLLNEGLK